MPLVAWFSIMARQWARRSALVISCLPVMNIYRGKLTIKGNGRKDGFVIRLQGARLDDRTSTGVSALQYARNNNHIEVIKLLLEAGAKE